MTQLDSIFTSDATTVISDSVAIEETIPQTPVQVLRLLPKDTTSVELPQYYREGQFVGDTLYYQEVDAGNYGVSGTPLAHMAVHDDLITLLLLGCLLFFCFTLSHFWDFFTRQTEALFYSRKSEQAEGTGIEFQIMLGLLAVSCLVQHTLLPVCDDLRFGNLYPVIGVPFIGNHFRSICGLSCPAIPCLSSCQYHLLR